jgi:hypothetical protein
VSAQVHVKGPLPASPRSTKMTPEEKRRRDAREKARAEKIKEKEDVMRAVAILITDAWTLDELREHVVRRLLALPKEERMREIKRIMRAVDTDIHG